MTVLATVTIGKNSRITVPKEVRNLLELEEGDELLFFKTRGWKRRVCLRKGSPPSQTTEKSETKAP
jgi:AbrB family looped-hinge helix DNA binding protein